jgi:cephalosporin-C deacetylase-like acetyl esterase
VFAKLQIDAKFIRPAHTNRAHPLQMRGYGMKNSRAHPQLALEFRAYRQNIIGDIWKAISKLLKKQK